jgi:hypothetical protein
MGILTDILGDEKGTSFHRSHGYREKSLQNIWSPGSAKEALRQLSMRTFAAFRFSYYHWPLYSILHWIGTNRFLRSSCRFNNPGRNLLLHLKGTKMMVNWASARAQKWSCRHHGFRFWGIRCEPKKKDRVWPHHDCPATGRWDRIHSNSLQDDLFLDSVCNPLQTRSRIWEERKSIGWRSFRIF